MMFSTSYCNGDSGNPRDPTFIIDGSPVPISKEMCFRTILQGYYQIIEGNEYTPLQKVFPIKCQKKIRIQPKIKHAFYKSIIIKQAKFDVAKTKS